MTTLHTLNVCITKEHHGSGKIRIDVVLAHVGTRKDQMSCILGSMSGVLMVIRRDLGHVVAIQHCWTCALARR